MSTTAGRRVRRLLPRTIASMFVATGAVFMTMALATPAHAAEGDIRVSLGGLNSSITAGGNGDSFSVRAENRTSQPQFPLRRVIVVQLPGLTPDQVNLSFRGNGFGFGKESPAAGEVRFIESVGFNLNARDKSDDTKTVQLTLKFTGQAPAGRAAVTASVFKFNELMGADTDTMNVRAAFGNQPSRTQTTEPPTTTEPATPGPTTTDEPLNPQALDPNSVPNPIAHSTAIPPVLYILGAILVAVGGGIFWLLFRNNKAPAEAYPTGDYVPVRPPTLGYPTDLPRRPANLNPTAVMPVVRDPGADPWAETADDQTRDFGSGPYQGGGRHSR